ncbi:MAG: hypothetical protein EBZ47_05335 [Chlamydiae bacterium]|nr:hypothetical protein [Chlamydiota bacterium]
MTITHSEETISSYSNLPLHHRIPPSEDPLRFKSFMECIQTNELDCPEKSTDSLSNVFELEPKRKKGNSLATAPYLPTPSLVSSPAALAITSAPITPSIKALDELFEKMASSMILMNSDGVQTTKVFLSEESLSNPMWKDLEITIEEYNTAPKIFNVKITAPAQIIEQFNLHIAEFIRLFQERKFGFSINRIDMEIAHSKPIFSRKENIGQDEGKDQQGST